MAQRRYEIQRNFEYLLVFFLLTCSFRYQWSIRRLRRRLARSVSTARGNGSVTPFTPIPSCSCERGRRCRLARSRRTKSWDVNRTFWPSSLTVHNTTDVGEPRDCGTETKGVVAAMHPDPNACPSTQRTGKRCTNHRRQL